MSKPVLILDPDWRRMDELFSETAKARLFADYEVVWGEGWANSFRLAGGGLTQGRGPDRGKAKG